MDYGEYPFLYVSPQTETLWSLRLMHEFLEKTDMQPYYWRWVITFADGLLLNCLVLALQGTDLINVLKKDSAEALVRSETAGTRLKKELYLADFKCLLRMAQDPQYMRQYVHSRHLTVDPETIESLCRLHGWRNAFTHSGPGSLSLELSGLPIHLLRCLSVVRFLALECGNVYFTDVLEEDVSFEIQCCIEHLERLVSTARSS
jgi:hypothetical protein